MKRLMKTAKMHVALVTALLLVAVSCAIVFGSSSPGALATAQSTSEASPADSFGVLREDATSTPPAEVLKAVEHAPPIYDLDLQGARRAPGSGAWLIPGSGELCIAVEDSEGLGMSCSSLAEALKGNLTFIERSTTGAASTVVGAAPDGITSAAAHNADGDVIASASVQANTYVVSAAGLAGTTLSP